MIGVAFVLAFAHPGAVAPGIAEAPVASLVEEARAARVRAVDFLVANQSADGSWGSARNATYNDLWENPETHKAWTVATTGLVCWAFLREGDVVAASLERGIDALIAGTTLERCSEWDMDDFWGYAYGLQALSRVLVDPRWSAETPRRKAIAQAARTYLQKLVHMRSGGWGYYANPDANWMPEWTTSFGTATAVLALDDARRAGLDADESVWRASRRALELCRLPTGAYTYSLMPFASPGRAEGIDQVKSSLGRSLACNVALRAADGNVTDDDMARALDRFFEHHRFLQIAKGRPIPHESWYAVASYFYWYGHMHAALAIAALPQERRAPFAAKLARIVVDNQEKNGSMWDHVMHDYPRFYGTAYGLIALQIAGAELR